MNWIDFMKEKPKAEPKRRVLVLDKHGDAYSMWSDCPFMSESNRTHWAEIEPPPKPDPFEEWFEREHSNLLLKDKHSAQVGWDAAMKWKEGQK